MWESVLTSMLRVLIDDLSSPYVYPDSSLQSLLIVAMHSVLVEVPTVTTITYSIDISNEIISPDPIISLNGSEDIAFTTLSVLKAACMLDVSVFKDRARSSGLRIKIGDATISTPYSKELTILIKEGPCKTYKDFKLRGQLSDLHNLRAVLSPSSGPNRHEGYIGDNRGGAWY